MDYDIREVLDSLDKSELIDLIIEHADNGFYPHELFMLRADYQFSKGALIDIWESAYDKADQMEDNHEPYAADYLNFCAEEIYRLSKKLNDKERIEVCEMLVDDLARAAEEDGIGMYEDSEWIYEETRDMIVSELKKS